MKLSRFQFSNVGLVEFVKKRLKLGRYPAELPKYVNNFKISKDTVYGKIKDVNTWYTKIIGLDEVKLYQDKVTHLQERLLAAQEKRRNVGLQLAEVRSKSKDLQDQIHKVKRQENLQQFLELMREETELLKLEEGISHTFQECDREEREIFTAFTNAVRDSHEKQRAQLEYTKYFGIILSIVGSLLTFCYSTIRKHDLRRCIEENIAKVSGVSEPVLSIIERNSNELEAIKHMLGPSLLTYTNTKSGNQKGKEADISQVISKFSVPILKRIDQNERELKEMKLILQQQSDVLPVIKGLDRYIKQLGEIKHIVKNSENKSVRDNFVVSEAATEYDREQLWKVTIFYGLAIVGVMTVIRALFN